MKVPEGRSKIARRFNGGFRQLKPIESRRDERKLGFVRAVSAALRGFLVLYSLLPRLKPWAIFFRPAGT